MMGSPKLCSVVEGLEEIFRFERIMAQLLYLYGHSKAARRVLKIRLYRAAYLLKIGLNPRGYSPSALLPLNGSRRFGGYIQHHTVHVFDFVRNPVRDFY